MVRILTSLALVMTLAACAKPSPLGEGPAMAESARTKPTPVQPPGVAKDAPMKSTIPTTFSTYASHQLSDGATCVAGAVTDEDGMNQQPLAYLKGRDGQVHWMRQLTLQEGTYQARATACLQQGERLYVLVQADTQPSQTLSQTLLSVTELDANDGAVKSIRAVAVPNVADAYSAWVDEQSGFSIEDGTLVVRGLYFRLDAPEARHSFTSVLKLNH